MHSIQQLSHLQWITVSRGGVLACVALKHTAHIAAHFCTHAEPSCSCWLCPTLQAEQMSSFDALIWDIPSTGSGKEDGQVCDKEANL